MPPLARLAYDACLSAGSTANPLPQKGTKITKQTASLSILHYAVCTKWSPPPGNCTGLNCLPSEWIADYPLGAKLASLTGFAPVISCMRGRHVGWTTPQGQKFGEDREICTPDLVYVTHPLWLTELCPQ